MRRTELQVQIIVDGKQPSDGPTCLLAWREDDDVYKIDAWQGGGSGGNNRMLSSSEDDDDFHCLSLPQDDALQKVNTPTTRHFNVFSLWFIIPLLSAPIVTNGLKYTGTSL